MPNNSLWGYCIITTLHFLTYLVDESLPTARPAHVTSYRKREEIGAITRQPLPKAINEVVQNQRIEID